jgi:hypothetical protein
MGPERPTTLSRLSLPPSRLPRPVATRPSPFALGSFYPNRLESQANCIDFSHSKPPTVCGPQWAPTCSIKISLYNPTQIEHNLISLAAFAPPKALVQHRERSGPPPNTRKRNPLPVRPLLERSPVARGSEGMIAGGLAAPLTLTQSVEAAGSSTKPGQRSYPAAYGQLLYSEADCVEILWTGCC